jgi:uncharacterized protein YbcV (DUF1398 family)
MTMIRHNPQQETTMETSVKAVIAECTKASDEQRVTFPQVVGQLMAAGVERYHADLLRAEKTYYMPNDESEVVSAAATDTTPPGNFSATGVAAAVRAIQHQAIQYREFCERIAAAGCVGYFVSLAGRRAVYYGRTGDSYVEPFPAAN